MEKETSLRNTMGNFSMPGGLDCEAAVTLDQETHRDRDPFSNIGTTLAWRDVTVIIRGKRKYSDKVVTTSTGYALPSSVTGLIGPPLSGKSTLLRALAGQLTRHAKVYGDVLTSAWQGQSKFSRSAFLPKDHELIETLSVKETLKFSAFLQLPDHVTILQKAAAVDEVLQIMDLDSIADTLVGGSLATKSLSLGERRRLHLGLGLISKPSLVFVDEPMCCLDSVASLAVMISLKKLSKCGCTVILTTQHTTADVFNLFERICLMADGKTVFFGPTAACLEHFSSCGFPCPAQQNPSDHVINTLNPGYEKTLKLEDCQEPNSTSHAAINVAVIIQTLEASFKGGPEAALQDSLVLQLLQKEASQMHPGHQATFVQQLVALMHRSFAYTIRDWSYFWLRFFLSSFIAACISTMYLGFKDTFSIQEQLLGTFYMVFLLCLLGICGLPALGKDLKVHRKEKFYGNVGHRGTLAFILGNLFSSSPFLLLTAAVCLAINSVPLLLFQSFSSYVYFTMMVFLCLLISESLMMIVASLQPHVWGGTVIVLITQGLLMLLSGHFRHANELSRTLWKYPSFLSFYTYTFEGFLQIELFSSDGLAYEQYKTELVNYIAPSLLQRRWMNFMVLVIMAIAYRILLLLIIEFQHLRWEPSWYNVVKMCSLKEVPGI